MRTKRTCENCKHWWNGMDNEAWGVCEAIPSTSISNEDAMQEYPVILESRRDRGALLITPHSHYCNEHEMRES